MFKIILVCIFILVVLITDIYLIFKITKSANILKKRYSEFIDKGVSDKMKFYIRTPIKGSDFFKMTNDGDDPCDLEDSLVYIDFIKNANIYLENKDYGSNN